MNALQYIAFEDELKKIAGRRETNKKFTTAGNVARLVGLSGALSGLGLTMEDMLRASKRQGPLKRHKAALPLVVGSGLISALGMTFGKKKKKKK